MSDLGDPKLGALLTVLDLALAEDKGKPERQYAFLEHLRDRIESRMRDAAAAVRASRSKTPPPRRPSSPMLPPAPPLHSREETAPHNTARLVEESEAKRPEDFENRTTPLVPAPIETTRRHPKDRR